MKPAFYPARPDLRNPYRSASKMHAALEIFKRGGARQAMLHEMVRKLQIAEGTASTWINIFRRMT